MKKLLFILSLAAGIATFSGCGPTRYTVSEQPAPPYYARPAAPGVGYVWIDGDWYWRGGRYALSQWLLGKTKRSSCMGNRFMGSFRPGLLLEKRALEITINMRLHFLAAFFIFSIQKLNCWLNQLL